MQLNVAHCIVHYTVHCIVHYTVHCIALHCIALHCIALQVDELLERKEELEKELPPEGKKLFVLMERLFGKDGGPQACIYMFIACKCTCACA